MSTSLRARVESWDLYSYQQSPDIVVPDFKNGLDLLMKFSATHLCLPFIFAVAAREPGGCCCSEGAWGRESCTRTALVSDSGALNISYLIISSS